MDRVSSEVCAQIGVAGLYIWCQCSHTPQIVECRWLKTKAHWEKIPLGRWPSSICSNRNRRMPLLSNMQFLIPAPRVPSSPQLIVMLYLALSLLLQDPLSLLPMAPSCQALLKALSTWPHNSRPRLKRLLFLRTFTPVH